MNKHAFNRCAFRISIYMADGNADTLAVQLLLVVVVLFCILNVPNSSFGPQTSSSD